MTLIDAGPGPHTPTIPPPDAEEILAPLRVARSRRRRRRAIVRVLVPFVVVLTVVAAGGVVWVLRERTRAVPVSLETTLESFRADAGAASDAGAPTPGTPAPSGGAGIASAATEEGGRETPAPAAVGPAPAAPVRPSAPAPTAFAPPREGVYSYATEGFESISILGGRHDYPARSHAAIRRTGGCGWTVEHAVIEEHVDRHSRCSEPGRLLGLSDGRDVEFFGQRDGMDYSCDPPAVLTAVTDEPGTVHESTCSSPDGDLSKGRITYRGVKTVDVGGTPVATHHVVMDFVLSGRAQGTSHAEFWYEAGTGLIVQEKRQTETDADAAFGKVHYSERATFKLLSLTPMT